MPWILATLSTAPADTASVAHLLAAAAADAAGLAITEVVALVTVADASTADGAVVMVSGRPRTDSVETGIVSAVRNVIAESTGVAHELVVVVRL